MIMKQTMGQITAIPDDLISKYTMPHHGILKVSNSTVKFYTVFDASAKTSNGKSLNDEMFNGSKLQKDIGEVLLIYISTLLLSQQISVKCISRYLNILIII